ncbi:MAG TPA: ankyrin repeat domain-containing protein [Planctomycetota bacterium]|jgi:ankyrin repeat protein
MRITVVLFIIALLCGCGSDTPKHAAQSNPSPQSTQPSLIESAMAGDVGKVKRCLDAGANVVLADGEMHTPLHFAAMLGHTDVVKLLLEHKASVDARDNYGYTPLCFAARRNQVPTARVLLTAGANVNAKTNTVGTSLHLAAENGYLEMVNLLLENGAEVDARDNKNIWTPLHAASYKGHLEVAEALLKKNADLKAKHRTGWTALHFAVQSGNPKLVRALVKNGADVEASDADGRTPIAYASSIEIVSVLVECGAKMHDNGGQPKPSDDPALNPQAPHIIDETHLAQHEDHMYTVQIDSDAICQIADMPAQRMTGQTNFRYRRDQKRAKVSLFEISDYLKFYVNGEFERESSSDKNGIRKRTRNESREILYERDAKPEFREFIKERYSLLQRRQLSRERRT